MSSQDPNRQAYVRGQMHQEFVRDDFFDKAAAHAGVKDGDKVSREQLAAFDKDRQARHEQRHDTSRTARIQAVLYRLRDDRDAARYRHRTEQATARRDQGRQR